MPCAANSEALPEPGPLVSIVMPTYNRAHMVGQAIDAVVAQTYTNWELILVNDGSKDNTRQIIDGYAASDPRIRCIHKDNEGIPDTVNRGWREARGGYATWTSDDNYYHADAIQTMVELMEAHPDVGMCYTDVNDVDADGKLLRLVDTGPPERLDPARDDCCCGVRGCLLLRRDVIRRVGEWDRRWVRCHDFDYYIRIYRQFKVAHIPKSVYDYMCHDASMTGNYEAIALEEAELLEHYCPAPEQHARIWAPRYAAIARWFAARQDWGKAWSYSRKAARLDARHREYSRWVCRAWLHSLSPSPVRALWQWARMRRH